MNKPDTNDVESAFSASRANGLPFGAEDNLPLLLSARDAATLVGVSERTWRTWDSAGRVPPAILLGRSKLWSPFELVEWVRQRCSRRAESA